jgi:hypothetical protein
MEIARHPFYTFKFEEALSLLSFVWTERTSEMTDRDYQEALRAYARVMIERHARRGLIDLRCFRRRVGDDLMSWRVKEIIPLYHQAGLEKFAYVLPAGVPAPPDDAPATAETGERFRTKRFASEEAAVFWLTTDP